MPVFAYLEAMEVHFSPNVETPQQQVALASGKEAEQLVQDTITRMLENQSRFIAGVQRGIDQADRGEFVEHKDVVSVLIGCLDREAHSVGEQSRRRFAKSKHEIKPGPEGVASRLEDHFSSS